MVRLVRPASGQAEDPSGPVGPAQRLATHDARLPSWPGALGSSTKRPKIRMQSLPSPAVRSLRSQLGIAACGASPPPALSGKEPVAPTPPRSLNPGLAWCPRADPLPPSPADGILGLWHRRNRLTAPSSGIKTRPAERPPPGRSAGLTGGVQIRRIWAVEMCAKPGDKAGCRWTRRRCGERPPRVGGRYDRRKSFGPRGGGWLPGGHSRQGWTRVGLLPERARRGLLLPCRASRFGT
jgi:hypothetical protein